MRPPPPLPCVDASKWSRSAVLIENRHVPPIPCRIVRCRAVAKRHVMLCQSNHIFVARFLHPYLRNDFCNHVGRSRLVWTDLPSAKYTQKNFFLVGTEPLWRWDNDWNCRTCSLFLIQTGFEPGSGRQSDFFAHRTYDVSHMFAKFFSFSRQLECALECNERQTWNFCGKLLPNLCRP